MEYMEALDNKIIDSDKVSDVEQLRERMNQAVTDSVRGKCGSVNAG